MLRKTVIKPAGSEYVRGEIIQKLIPKGRHSRLRGTLCTVINQVAENSRVAYANLTSYFL